MAKMFEQIEEETQEKISPSKESRFSLVDYFFVFIISVSLIILVVIIVVGEKEKKYKDKKIMDLVELLEMKNGNILTRKVKYETYKKKDPQDTSDIFFEVVNGNDEYAKGNLIKFPHRFVNETQIEGETYCVIDPEQIQFQIDSANVEESLLKR